VKGSRLQKIIR